MAQREGLCACRTFLDLPAPWSPRPYCDRLHGGPVSYVLRPIESFTYSVIQEMFPEWISIICSLLISIIYSVALEILKKARCSGVHL